MTTITDVRAVARYAPPFLTSLPLWHQGKTRDTFPCKDPNKLLVVATNRLSTHNVVHKSLIPFKGEVLTALTVFWLAKVLAESGIKNHLIAFGTKIYEHLPGERSDYPANLHHRAIVVEKLDMALVEFILRCYLAKASSFYRDFYSKGIVDPYGVNLRPGLPIMYRFEEPIFTPTDKSDTDEPLRAAKVMHDHRLECGIALSALGLVRSHLNRCGIEIIDTKFEIGHDPFGNPIMADEVATPDSSRFCELDLVRQGEDPSWLDKQIARNEAERVWAGGAKTPLEFSERIVKDLAVAYLVILERITGKGLNTFQRAWLS
jgi:phosphoribosylaminoimidazole-succinocarboxamide synthase